MVYIDVVQDKNGLNDRKKWNSEKRPSSLTPAVCCKLVASEACRGIFMHKNPISVSGERDFFVLATTRTFQARYVPERAQYYQSTGSSCWSP